jgi:hypothetical protein
MKIQQTPNRTSSCGCRHHAVLSIGMRRTDFQSTDNVLYVHVMIIMSKAQTQAFFWPYFRLPPRCWLNLRSYSDSWPARMGPIRCPETSVNNCHTMPRNTPEDRRFHLFDIWLASRLFIRGNKHRNVLPFKSNTRKFPPLFHWLYDFSFFKLKNPAADTIDAPQTWRLIVQPYEEDYEVFSASVEWNWPGKTEVLGENPVPMPLCPPQIPHGPTRASAVRGRQLTAWAMARPYNFS